MSSSSASAAGSSVSAPLRVAGGLPPSSAAAYARFIPREELAGRFAAWTPDDFNLGSATSPETVTPQQQAAQAAALLARQQAEHQAAQAAARQSGYQDGYRDGLAALESFKRSVALQGSERIGGLVQAFDAQFQQLEQEMASAVSDTAVQLARQVLREELTQDIERVARVAQEAVQALLLSARHITVRVHPDDEALVQGGAGELLASRGARVVADESIARGGCRVESDIGAVDATVQTRWKQALGTLGAQADDAAPDGEPL
jgi:flagellar assembly protein FliH